MLRKLALMGVMAFALLPSPTRADVTAPTYKDSAGFSRDAIGVFPLSTAGASGGDVNVSQVGGAAVKTGAGTASGALRVELPTDGTGKVAATQSGTWTVQPGNTANTTAWKVDGSAVTQPISGSVTPLASENHVGEVGNNQITLTSAQTVTASSAYATGNAVGGLITLTSAARVSGASGATGTSGLIESVVVNSKSAQTTQMDLVIFNANPTGTTCTDKTAIAVAAADFDKILGVAHVTDWTNLGTPSVGQAQNLAMPYALTSNTTLYGCLVTRATPTFTATTDISVALRVIRN